MFEVKTDDLSGWFAPIGQIRDELIQVFEEKTGESAEDYYDALEYGTNPCDCGFEFLRMAYVLDDALIEMPEEMCVYRTSFSEVD